jgi:hypothetical protein
VAPLGASRTSWLPVTVLVRSMLLLRPAGYLLCSCSDWASRRRCSAAEAAYANVPGTSYELPDGK